MMKKEVNKAHRGSTVFVGLSGGVDSAVTAALLKERGANVTGVFIKGWYPPDMRCTWAEDRRDAMRVAAHLRIPFLTLDASVEYRSAVIDYLIREYREGRTPNPDIRCNREVKFGAFHRFAKGQGADFIATGHYARVERDSDGAHLLRGIDETKDQSYFLWAVSREAIADSIFPLGDKRKEEVRKLAKRLELPNAQKKDSQGICFLGPVSMDDFLRAELPHESGKALDAAGREVGRHDGVVLYTLGERVALAGSAHGPWYVQMKDLSANTLTVSHERNAQRSVDRIQLTNTSWLNEVANSSELVAQYRYHGPIIRGTLSKDRTSFTPHEPLPEPAASGQSLVFYQGDECIGGGIIS